MRILLWYATFACATPPTEIEPTPQETPVSPVIPCTLPKIRPPELAIQFRQTVIPHGMEPENYGLTLRSVCGPDEPLCRVVDDTGMDRLYAQFQEKKFGSLGRTSEGHASPHYGSRSLELAWDGGHCAVADSHQSVLIKEEADILQDLIQQVTAATYAK